ncbi:MAG: tRNA uracil 4-sulfurtransferase ThiI [Eubacteriales bacterium]|nr:tRNA uracil 4-sulfurtransferase ThiI [Eubacteriales bacterium]
MEKLLLVKYSEIFLKGLNRPWFLNLLLTRIREAVKGLEAKAWLSDSRVYVSGYTDEAAVIEKLVKVFGVHSVCPAIEMEKDDFSLLEKEAVSLMKDIKGTFKVNARRSDKNYPLESPAINARIGAAILKQCPDLSVDVKNPDHILNVEIRKKAYMYVKVIPAVGGMPVGSNGKACLLLSGGIDSPVAGYMLARRGVSLCAVHYYSFPYTGERSKEKVLTLAKQLRNYCGAFKLYIVPFTNIQMEIHQHCPDEYTTLIMRRFMMRIADRIAEKDGATALITGESIGQVASQTMEALACTDAVAQRPVFRPLIGFDKEHIIKIAKEIDTYETSCLPYEDCCTVFTPRHPVTKPKLEKAELAEKGLDVETLIQEAVNNVDVIEI